MLLTTCVSSSSSQAYIRPQRYAGRDYLSLRLLSLIGASQLRVPGPRCHALYHWQLQLESELIADELSTWSSERGFPDRNAEPCLEIMHHGGENWIKMVIYVRISSRNGQGDDEVWPPLRIKYPWSIPSLIYTGFEGRSRTQQAPEPLTWLYTMQKRRRLLQCSEVVRMS